MVDPELTDRVGRLAGWNDASITASYAFGTKTGGENDDNIHDGSDRTVSTASGLTTSIAGTNWNNASRDTAGAWNFGSSSQNPALVYADYDWYWKYL